MKKLVAVTMAVCLLLVGCNTLNKVVVSIVDAEDAAMREWADAHNRGLTTKEFDLKVDKAHQQFRQVAASAKIALETYKKNGDKGAYLQAIETVRVAAGEVLNLVVSITSPARGNELKSMLRSAPVIGGN